MTYDDLKPILILRDDRATHDDMKGVELAQELLDHMWNQMRPTSLAEVAREGVEAVMRAAGTGPAETPSDTATDDTDNPFEGLS